MPEIADRDLTDSIDAPRSGISERRAGVRRPASGVTAFVKDHHLIRHSVALIDMNGDNRPIADVLVGKIWIGSIRLRRSGSARIVLR